MKRCPKCNRTFPDDNQKFCTVDGGLLVMATGFDPNATIVSAPDESSRSADTGELPPIHTSAAPTVALNRETGPTGSRTVAAPPGPSASTSAPLPHTPATPMPPPPPISPPPAAAPPKKKSKLPLVLGILAILVVLGIGAAVAAFFLVIKPRMDQTAPERVTVEQTNQNENENINTAPTPAAETSPAQAEYVPPPDTVKFTNSATNLDGRLAEHYVDFSFYYPEGWVRDPKAGVPGASNFAKVERSLPPDFTQENFAVGWYTSEGTFAADEAKYPQLVELMSTNLSGGFPGYRKVSEGPTKINSLDAYEFRFVSESKGTEKGDIQLWGRVVFVPTGVAGDKTGATLIMLATSLAPELSGVNDVGVKGQMPVILDSFRFGKQ